MSSIEIKLPASLEKYSIHQANDLLQFLSSRNNKKDWLTLDILELISIVSGVSVKDLRRVDIGSIKEAYAHLRKTIARPKQDPPEKIKIKGKVYEFDKKMGKQWAASRFIDAENSGTDLKTFPEKFVAISYLEEGKEYDDTSVDERAELFKNHFPGSVYVDLTDFFLRKFEMLSPGFLVLQNARSQILRKQALTMLKKMQRTG